MSLEVEIFALELQQNQHYELSYELFNLYWEQSRLTANERKVEDVLLEKVYEFGKMISTDSPFF